MSDGADAAREEADMEMGEDPCNPEFWWRVHERGIELVGQAFRRNPNDIKEALGMTPEAREAILDAHKASQRFVNINQGQAACEAAMYTFVARLLDAGVITTVSTAAEAKGAEATKDDESRALFPPGPPESRDEANVRALREFVHAIDPVQGRFDLNDSTARDVTYEVRIGGGHVGFIGVGYEGELRWKG